MALTKWDVQVHGANNGNLVPVLSLQEYLTQDWRLSIPPWQREYTWDSTSEDGEVRQLMEDLGSFVHSGATDYLIGAVILCETDDPSIKYLIDGQQRTVTLTLFLMCAFKYLTKELNDRSDHALLTELEHSFNRGSHFDPQPSVMFAQNRADSVLQQVRAWLVLDGSDADKHLRELETYSRTQKNILSVVRYLAKGLSDEEWFKKTEIKEALWKILRGVRVLQLKLDNQSEAIQVYDRINNRGRHLSGGDLVKNLIFANVDDSKFEDVNDNWISVVETLRHLSSAKMQEPTFLLRQLAWGYKQGKTKYDDLPSFFGEHFVSGAPDGGPIDPVEFSKTLGDAAEALSEFAQKSSHRKHGMLPLLNIPNHLGVVQHFAILLAGESLKDRSAFIELYEQVATRTMLYAFAQERTPEFETLVNKWAHQVHLAGPNASVADIQNIFSKHVGYPPMMIDQMVSNASKWSYQKAAERKRIRASLALMSWWIDGRAKEDNGSIDEYLRTRKRKGAKFGWDVDHVEAQGSAVLGMTDEDKNSFGNLVLLHPSDNRGAKNATAALKQLEYEQSRLLLTKSLVNGNYPARMQRIVDHMRSNFGEMNAKALDQWGSDAVASRTKMYVGLLKAIVTRSMPG